MLVGDFNSNAIWDKDHPADVNHSALVSRLASLGLVSAYHHLRNEPHGGETEPSYFHHWKQEKPFHIDYCFLPRVWAEHISAVEIGGFESLSKYSDHRPLMVELPDGVASAAKGVTTSPELAQLVANFHQLIRMRELEFSLPPLSRLPSASEVVGSTAEKKWLPVPGMHGGFSYQLERHEASPKLAVHSWSRVVHGSEQMHEITCDGAFLVRENAE